MRLFEMGVNRTQAGAVYLDGITDKTMVNQYILHSLMIDAGKGVSLSQDQSVLAFIKTNVLTVGEVYVLNDWDSIILAVLSGDTVIFIEEPQKQ